MQILSASAQKTYWKCNIYCQDWDEARENRLCKGGSRESRCETAASIRPLPVKPIELVCPAGSLPALKAAIDNGADCVYMDFRDATNARNFVMAGDTELGLLVKNTLDAIDI